jgi:hypothetical protein
MGVDLAFWGCPMSAVVTVNELLERHVGLSIECLDRIYLNGYVPNLQVGGQVVTFLTQHLGRPIPSPAVFEQIGARFRREVAAFAKTHQIPLVRFDKNDRKIEVMHPYQQRLAAAGVSGVAAIGVAQEFAPVWTGYPRESHSDIPQFTFAKANRRVTGFYFYVWDTDFGPGFIKICSPTSPTRSRCGSTATSGPSSRPDPPGSGSLSCPTGSPPAPTRRRCRPSAISWDQRRSRPSSTAG